MRTSRSGWPTRPSSPFPRSRWKATRTARLIPIPRPTPPGSRGPTRTASSAGASGTTCRRRRRGNSPAPCSTSRAAAGAADVPFQAILEKDLRWQPFAAFPPEVRLAVVVGEPSRPGPYVIRVRVPDRVRLMPHRHPEDRVYTVISGVFYIGLGDRFDADGLQAYPPG